MIRQKEEMDRQKNEMVAQLERQKQHEMELERQKAEMMEQMERQKQEMAAQLEVERRKLKNEKYNGGGRLLENSMSHGNFPLLNATVMKKLNC